MELAWGPTWSGSLKSLWVGEGEAIGDITVGEELAEHVGSEPIHPVLLDLCTGVAFPAFPALLAAEQGVNDLFLPLRYGRVSCSEKMPRRFYCRAKWHTSGLDSETQVFDLDFVDRDGRRLGGIREFTVKRAPREALLRGLGGDATRLLYTLGWHEVPAPAATEDAGSADGTWLVAGFDELAADLAGCIPFDRHDRSGAAGAGVRAGPGAGSAVRRHRVAQRERPARTSRAPMLAARLEAEIADLLSAVHTVLARAGEAARRAVDRHRTGGRDRIRRAGRPGAGGAVGIRAHRDQRGADPALPTGRLRWLRRGRAAAGRPARHAGRRAGNRAAPREVAGVAAAALGPQRSSGGSARGATTCWRPPNAARSTTCG